MIRAKEDLAVLNTFWCWRDNLISQDTMLTMFGDLKKNHIKIMEDFKDLELKEIKKKASHNMEEKEK